MSLSHNQFISKLNELESEYRQMIDQIRLCHNGTRKELIQEQEKLLKECIDQETQLEEIIAGGKSKAVVELSAKQLRYFKEIRAELEEKIPQYLDSMNTPTDTSRAEAMALYAEFAIDNAIQGIRYALHAVFSAAELQMKATEASVN